MPSPEDFRDSPFQVRVTTLADLRSEGMSWAEISDAVQMSESVLHRTWRKARQRLGVRESQRFATLVDRLLDGAKCLGDDNPAWITPAWAHDSGNHPTVDVVALEATYEAWSTCQRCPVQQECLDFVRPEEGNFDGVAGGIVYVQGKDQTDRFLSLLETSQDLLRD